MVGPVPSLAHVPLREVLPDHYLGAEDELRRAANELDDHRSTADRLVWHWYPDRKATPQTPDSGLYLLLVDTTITLYNTHDDWLELTLDIAWLGANLTVNAAVEVACWCSQDHNMHQVRRAQWHVVNSHQLAEAFTAGTAMLVDVLDSGPFEPNWWRVQAGLPDTRDNNR